MRDVDGVLEKRATCAAHLVFTHPWLGKRYLKLSMIRYGAQRIRFMFALQVASCQSSKFHGGCITWGVESGYLRNFLSRVADSL